MTSKNIHVNMLFWGKGGGGGGNICAPPPDKSSVREWLQSVYIQQIAEILQQASRTSITQIPLQHYPKAPIFLFWRSDFTISAIWNLLYSYTMPYPSELYAVEVRVQTYVHN